VVLLWNNARHMDPLRLPTLRRDVSSLRSVSLEQTMSLWASMEKVDEDRVVPQPIWISEQ
jgi:hypothetical protein